MEISLNEVSLFNKVENSMTNGEIANYEQFLLLQRCLLKLFVSGKVGFKIGIKKLKYSEIHI